MCEDGKESFYLLLLTSSRYFASKITTKQGYYRTKKSDSNPNPNSSQDNDELYANTTSTVGKKKKTRK